MKYGFVRVGAAVPKIKISDCEYNASSIITASLAANKKNIQILVFPELTVTGYTCGDLFFQDILLESAIVNLKKIIDATKELDIVLIVGVPIKFSNVLYNCAVVFQKGRILGIVPKTYIPGYNEYYEHRWFRSGKNIKENIIELFGEKIPFGVDVLFQAENLEDVCFGIEICEDLWAVVPPSSIQSINGASFIFNPSASNDLVGKSEYRKELIKQQSARCIGAYIYCSAGIGESTTDLVFGGHSVIAENGVVLKESERFLRDTHIIFTDIDISKLINDRQKNTVFYDCAATFSETFRKVKFSIEERNDLNIERNIEKTPFVPDRNELRNKRCKEIFNIQTFALASRIEHIGAKHAVIGISGGLDSTLAMLATVQTFDLLGLSHKNIVAVTMPGFGTTDITYKNAVELINTLGVEFREIDIKEACMNHFKDIGHDPNVFDVTYENVQARERMQILMDLANKIGGIVIGTGDLSEIALGWSTYNGDHMSMYSVNCGIPKTLVKFLIEWVADNVSNEEVKTILHGILNTPISPELIPPKSKSEIKQKTEEIIGPYELHDFFLYHMIRCGASPSKILYLAESAFDEVYKKQEIVKYFKVFIKRFFNNQFKRSCIPDGPKVGSVSLSPRGDWRMPSDAEYKAWIDDIETYVNSD